MRRTISYWTGGPAEADVWRNLHATVEELGYELVEAKVTACGPEHRSGGFEVSVTLEVPDVPEPLLGRVEALLCKTQHPPIQLSAIDGFCDLYWQPLTRREAMINETVRLDGPTRYGVIGLLSGEYRICVGPNDLHSQEGGYCAAEPDLVPAVARVVRYIEHGPEDVPLDAPGDRQ